MKWTSPEVKVAAQALGIPVHQPTKVNTGELASWLQATGADVALVMAYGRILPSAVLEALPRGCLNLHASLLPKYRGAAPINWALYDGETETGVALMKMDAGMDTGPVYCSRTIEVSPRENAGQLADEIASLAATVVREDLPRALDGALQATPQDDERASYAPPIEKQHLQIDWNRSAAQVVNQVRAFAPRPGARTQLPDRVGLKILEATAAGEGPGHEPGRIVIADKKSCFVQTGSGLLSIERAQVDGKRPMGAVDLVNGRLLVAGAKLGARD